MTLPVLYSFRRCPFAMRARLALYVSGRTVALREILLRDKPSAMLAASPKGTVPVLVLPDRVVDESLDIMHWALAQNDPEGWLDMPACGHALIATADGPFKQALDRTKYATRYPGSDPAMARASACDFLLDLDARLARHGALTGPRATLADMAILPFVRQFAGIDRAWFSAQDWPHLRGWLDSFLASNRFAAVMRKFPVWSNDAPAPQLFP